MALSQNLKVDNMNTYNLTDLTDLVKALKSERTQGTEYIGLGTTYERMVQTMIEGGWQWPVLKAVTDAVYASSDYAE